MNNVHYPISLIFHAVFEYGLKNESRFPFLIMLILANWKTKLSNDTEYDEVILNRKVYELRYIF